MTLIILVIALVAILTGGYYFRQYTVERYKYNVAAIGSMAVSFIGTVMIATGAFYLHYNIALKGGICLAIGLLPYVLMFIRDYKRTNWGIAIWAMTLRFVISAIILLAITILVLGGKRDPRELYKYTEHKFVR